MTPKVDVLATPSGAAHERRPERGRLVARARSPTSGCSLRPSWRGLWLPLPSA